jgi:hypothetical protein
VETVNSLPENLTKVDLKLNFLPDPVGHVAVL